MKTSVQAFIRRGELSGLLRLLQSAAALAVSLLAISAGPLPMKIGTVVWFGYSPFYFAKAQDFFRRCRQSPRAGVRRAFSIGRRRVGGQQGRQHNQCAPEQ
jgi:hypothetical protein